MFQLVFFVCVEVPSMIVMTIHKLLMMASGREMQLLTIWAYRTIGFFGLPLLLPIVLAPLFSDAGYVLWVLVAAVVTLVVVFLRRASTGVGSPQADRPRAVAPAYTPLLKRSGTRRLWRSCRASPMSPAYAQPEHHRAGQSPGRRAADLCSVGY